MKTKMRGASDWESQAQASVDYLEDWGGEALASAKKINPSDRDVSERAVKELQPSFKALAQALEPLRATAPAHLDEAYKIIAKLISAAHVIGILSIASKDGRDHAKKLQSIEARQGKAAKLLNDPREKEIVEAIERATKGWDGSKPYKLAGSIAKDLESRGITRSAKAIQNRLKNGSS